MSDHVASPAEEADAEAGAPRGPGLVRGLLAAILDSVKTRLDLAAVEAEIYLVYVAQLLLWGFAAVACALLAIVFALTAVIIAVWQTHRMAGLIGSMVDRKSTRLNSSHMSISYAVFCLKKKTQKCTT